MFFIDGAAGPNEVKLQRWYRLSGRLVPAVMAITAGRTRRGVPANGQGKEGPWS
jgi:hypothetical protein